MTQAEALIKHAIRSMYAQKYDPHLVTFLVEKCHKEVKEDFNIKN